MHTDPAVPIFVAAIFMILIIGSLLRKIKQSHVVVYLCTGFLLGPHLLGFIEDQQALTRIGSFGVIFLLFFIGMEISPRRLVENWVISVGGTFLQVFTTIFFISLLGMYLGWPVEQTVLIGFVMSLSSTAIVIKLLEDRKEINTRVGQDVLGILLVQDVLIVPMLICLSLLSASGPNFQEVALQILGGLIIIGLMVWITVKKEIHIPGLNHLKEDHELQVFAALGACFGVALFTGMMGLSGALGAFVGGMLIGATKETHWVRQKLHSIRTVFIAIFFVSMGMLIDKDLIVEKIGQIALLVLIVFLSNTILNALILKVLGEDWKVSLYGGSLLSQIGEFSFMIAAVGYQSGIIVFSTYEVTIAVIAMTLLLSPFWISFIEYLTEVADRRLREG